MFFGFFLLVNAKSTVFAGFPQKENLETAIYSDTLHACHYDIHLTDQNLTDKTIEGYTTIALVPLVNNLQAIKLELADLTVDSVFVGNMRTLAFNHSGNVIFINLQTPANTGDTILAKICYHGQPFVDPSGWGGFHFSGEYAFNLGVGFDAIPHNLGKAWFPCIDDFHDRALYDVFLRVPNAKKAISGGSLVEVISNGDNTSTWHWKTDFTLPTYLISASTGNYELRSDTYNGIQSQVPITFYCRPSDTSMVAGTFVNLKNILSIFENHFGPYPLERLGYTATANGAMEHAANISYPYSGWTGNTSSDWWYAHELSHMWFGDAVTCASAEDMWLNEGWAVWTESLYREGLYGKPSYKENMRSKLKDVLLSTHIQDGGYYALCGIPQTLTYGSTVYQKGGQVTHTLRGYLGDSLFFGGVKAYLQQFAYNYASTYDLRDFLTGYTGIDLVPFFDAWVFAAGFPHFSIDSLNSTPSGNGYDVTVFVRQKLKASPLPANFNHLEITFMNHSWEKITDTIIFSGFTGSKTFHLPFSPAAVMADLEEKISDATTDVAKTLYSTGETEYQQTYSKLIVEQIADSAFVRITHNWVAADSLIAPQPGLTVSDSRYWTVEGLFPKGFKAKGKFTYSKSPTLDNTLITNPNDSLVILYRPGAGCQWMGTPFTRQGGWQAGSVTVDNLQTGEYTLAVWDEEYLKTNENPLANKNFLRVYPNPASEKANIEINSNQIVQLLIYDSAGKQLDYQTYQAGSHSFVWGNPGKASGVYILKLTDIQGHLLESRKLVFE